MRSSRESPLSHAPVIRSGMAVACRSSPLTKFKMSLSAYIHILGQFQAMKNGDLVKSFS
jgi:hypothetical protein